MKPTFYFILLQNMRQTSLKRLIENLKVQNETPIK